MALNRRNVVIAIIVVAGAIGVYKLGWFGDSPEITLAGGAKASGDDIRGPLTVFPVVVQRGSIVVFSLGVIDANGQAVRAVSLPGGRRPDPPKLEVFNEQGQRVYYATLQYG